MSDLPKVKHRDLGKMLDAVSAVTGSVKTSIAAHADAIEARRTKRHEELVAAHKLHGQTSQHGNPI